MLSDCKQAGKSILDVTLTVVGVLVYCLGLARVIIHLHRKSPKVLMYHECQPRESDFTRGLSINTTPSQFAAHLRFLMRHYRVVSLPELFRQPSSEATVAITFDDGFRSVYEHAWPLLAARRVSATCYLVTDVIDSNALIWINELNWFLHQHGPLARTMVSRELGLIPNSSARAILRRMLERYDPSVAQRLLMSLRAAFDVDPSVLARTSQLYLRWDQITEMASAGMTFGNHTRSHPPLACLPVEPCREEIGRAAERLSHLPGAAATLAYPFGSRTETTRQVALELGYQSLLEVEGVNNPIDPTRIGRIKVGAISPAVLFARMEVLEPVKARLKDWLRRARSGSGGSSRGPRHTGGLNRMS